MGISGSLSFYFSQAKDYTFGEVIYDTSISVFSSTSEWVKMHNDNAHDEDMVFECHYQSYDRPDECDDESNLSSTWQTLAPCIESHGDDFSYELKYYSENLHIDVGVDLDFEPKLSNEPELHSCECIWDSDDASTTYLEDEEMYEPMGMLELPSVSFFQSNKLLSQSEPICDSFSVHILEECLKESQSLQECPLDSFQFDIQTCDEFFLHDTSCMLVQEFVHFQLDDIFKMCDIGFNQDICCVQHDTCMSYCYQNLQLLHGLQMLNDSGCNDNFQYGSWVRDAKMFDQWYPSYIIRLASMQFKENNVYDRGKHWQFFSGGLGPSNVV